MLLIIYDEKDREVNKKILNPMSGLRWFPLPHLVNKAYPVPPTDTLG